MDFWFRVDYAIFEEKKPIGPYGLAVYLCLARHANRTTGKSWPSYETIAAESQISVRKAKEVISRLVTEGVITKQEGGGRKNVNVYTLIGLKRALDIQKEKNGARGARNKAGNGARDDKNGAHGARLGGRNGAPCAPEHDLDLEHDSDKQDTHTPESPDSPEVGIPAATGPVCVSLKQKLTERVLETCEIDESALKMPSLRKSIELCVSELLALDADAGEFGDFKRWFYEVNWTHNPPRPIKPMHIAPRWPAFVEWKRTRRKKRRLAVIEPVNAPGEVAQEQHAKPELSEADRAALERIPEQLKAFASTFGNGTSGKKPLSIPGEQKSREQQIEELKARGFDLEKG